MTPYTPTQQHALAIEFAAWYARRVAECFAVAVMITALVIGGIR